MTVSCLDRVFGVVRYAFVKVQISCHKYNLKPSLVQYIYPISYKNAKKANPVKWICPY